MKMFSQYKLTRELILLLVTFGVTILLYFAFPDYYHHTLDVQAQLTQQQSPSIIGINITSPTTGQQVPVGLLRMSGTSADNPTTDCTVYADWNNTMPFQKAIATGPGGVNDYSTWTFTYTPEYHVITDGTNELTAKLSCVHDNFGRNLTKSYSVKVIGIKGSFENSTSTGTSGGTSEGGRGGTSTGTSGGTSEGGRGERLERPHEDTSRGSTGGDIITLPSGGRSGGTSTGTSGGTSEGTSTDTSTGTSGGTSEGGRGGTSTGTSGGTSGGGRGESLERSPRGDISRGTRDIGNP